MLSNYENGNEAGTREKAESIMNLLVGTQSADHKDWNGDGKISDPGDGYGFLLNGNNLGYVQAVYSYADYAVNAPGASQNMIINGKNVQNCSQNLARWMPELRQNVSTILQAAALSEKNQGIQRSAELANQILNGIDKNQNGEIEPISDECGVLVAHESTYHMADMPLLPVTANSLSTVTAISETVTPSQTITASSPLLVTPTKRQSQSGGQVTVAPTQQPSAPTQQPPAPTSGQHNPNPTREPRPTHNPGPPHPRPTKNHP